AEVPPALSNCLRQRPLRERHVSFDLPRRRQYPRGVSAGIKQLPEKTDREIGQWDDESVFANFAHPFFTRVRRRQEPHPGVKVDMLPACCCQLTPPDPGDKQ